MGALKYVNDSMKISDALRLVQVGERLLIRRLCQVRDLLTLLEWLGTGKGTLWIPTNKQRKNARRTRATTVTACVWNPSSSSNCGIIDSSTASSAPVEQSLAADDAA